MNALANTSMTFPGSQPLQNQSESQQFFSSQINQNLSGLQGFHNSATGTAIRDEGILTAQKNNE